MLPFLIQMFLMWQPHGMFILRTILSIATAFWFVVVNNNLKCVFENKAWLQVIVFLYIMGFALSGS